jgi:hypothetical protein
VYSVGEPTGDYHAGGGHVVRNCKAWSLCRVMASRAAGLDDPMNATGFLEQTLSTSTIRSVDVANDNHVLLGPPK